MPTQRQAQSINSTPSAPLLRVQDLGRTYQVSRGVFRSNVPLKAVDGVSLTINQGETFGLVGESGCGKSTLAKMLLGLERPTVGQILLKGFPLIGQSRREVAKQVQPVFQDPYSSLNPRYSVAEIIAKPLRVHKLADPAQRQRIVQEMLDVVGLPRRVYHSHTRQLSGGQRQRVAIARALIMHPEVVICDEPTSALDVSVQSQILNLLIDLRRELGLTYIFISHNLAVIQHLAHRVAVMYLGRIVEENSAAAIFERPRHPYTQALLRSVLTPDSALGGIDAKLGVAFPNPIDPPSGCAFHPRCSQAMPQCRIQAPALVYDGRNGVACFKAGSPLQC